MNRPTYLGSERIDDVARMCTELLSEIWVLRDRVTILERLLEEKSIIDRAKIDAYTPEGALAEELARERQELVERVIGAPFAGESD